MCYYQAKVRRGGKGAKAKELYFCVSASKAQKHQKKICPACCIKIHGGNKLRPQQKKEEMGGSGVHSSSSSSSSSSYLHYCAPFGLKMPTLRWVANVKGSSWLLVNVLSDYYLSGGTF